MRQQSQRRMIVAQRRQRAHKDVLMRRSKRHPQWAYLEFFEHVEQNHQWALLHKKVCMRRQRRLAREYESGYQTQWWTYR